MQSIHFVGFEDFIEANRDFLKELGVRADESGTLLTLAQTTERELLVEKGDRNQITVSSPSYIVRGLLRWLSLAPGETVRESVRFDSVGPMVDMSRNGVMTVAAVKNLLKRLARLGLNSCMLYMEDVYEVPAYPYFGYLRGRYSLAELKEMDDYAAALHIELIPAIQTLGHLANPLKWGFSNGFKDTQELLLVGSEKTYRFIDALISTLRQAFRSRKLHLGMDEAWNLGSGIYQQQNGFHEKFEIMTQHLREVLKITAKYNFEPMIWSDMFFDSKSETGGYYDPTVIFTEEDRASVPAVGLTYWDYYHDDASFYEAMLAKHAELSDNISFAGGIWTWNGVAPNYGRTIVDTKAALAACEAKGVQEIYATMWGDDGQETSIRTADFGLALFAEHDFAPAPTLDHAKQDFKVFLDDDAEDYLMLQAFDETPGIGADNLGSSNPSKCLLYQDLLLSMFDVNFATMDLPRHYRDLASRLAPLRNKSLMLTFYAQLADVLALKAPISPAIRAAYHAGDTAAIGEQIAQLKQLIPALEQLKQAHYALWHADYKPFGWEVMDIRYGGLISRANTVVDVLTRWLAQPTTTISELEEALLPYDIGYSYKDDALSNAQYGRIISPSKLSGV